MDKSHKALLIVCMQKDFVDEGAPMHVPGARGLVEAISGEIRYAREKNRPIVYVCDHHEPDDPEFEYWPPHSIRGTSGAEIIDSLAPQSGDHIVEKSAYSGFFKTSLETLLDELEIDEVLLCGVQTNVCVLYTAVDALQRGIRVIVPETCTASIDPDDHRFALRQITEVLKTLHRD